MHFDHELKSIHVHVSTSVGSTTVISLRQATSMAGEESVKQCTDEGDDDPHIKPTAFDMDKVKTTLKQFVRDWSQAGRAERAACYDPVVTAVEKRFPSETHDRRSVSVLVPGAGLGRLAHEFARRGYNCQGNEWSLFMLIASNFVLNRCKEVEDFRLYPWVHQWSNNMRSSDQTMHVTFPDINPSDLAEDVSFSMAAGDFLEVYRTSGVWDCVATVFFLDTAHNIVAYVETIWKILKPGGYWVNLGPLLYHYSEVPGESSIELSYEDLRNVIGKVGFDIEEEKENVKATYTQNPLSMLQYEYRCVFFVVRKPLEASLS
ncbi:hypothetical protein C0Q70_03209 [Pomacea canaliculata]|uniref:Carnosine N-methyltransferase n=1 Tax=Pomacea canaliculata TaxID=400727 RepID=A0A2T7PS32_POMCA|nr:hypothetical protein C0Q70_03209 [Pomacea canaliculata]